MEKNKKLRLLVTANCPLPDGEDFRRVSELWTNDKW